MKKTLFCFKGIPVTVDISWLLIPVLVSPIFLTMEGSFVGKEFELSFTERIILGILGPLGIGFSVLFHEFAHSFAALSHGINTKYIHLMALGGMACPVREFRKPRVEFEVAIAGPLSSIWLGLFLLMIALLVEIRFIVAFTMMLGVINLGLAAFNLVPAFPMDGGRVFRAFIWTIHGSPALATGIAAFISLGWMLLFIYYGANNGAPVMVIIGAFLIMANMGMIGLSIERRQMERRALHMLDGASPSVRLAAAQFARSLVDAQDGADGVDRAEASWLYIARKLEKS